MLVSCIGVEILVSRIECLFVWLFVYLLPFVREKCSSLNDYFPLDKPDYNSVT